VDYPRGIQPLCLAPRHSLLLRHSLLSLIGTGALAMR
jgi:hypothetical protein